MNFRRILCPIDFSEFNKNSNEYASVLASASGAEIVYLHVVPADVAVTKKDNGSKHDEASFMRKLESVQPMEDSIDSSHVIQYGPAGQTIADFANENQIDLIVIGTHGRTGFRRIIMGSIAESVVRNANCPVLAIKSDLTVASTE